MTKPRIFIAMHYMEIGGAESSLVGLLEALDPENVDVDLFIYSHQGLFMSAIPSYVNLLPENKTYSMFEKPLSQVLKCGQVGILAARLWAKFKHKAYRKANPLSGDDGAVFGYIGKYVSKVVPDINPQIEYDLAISYLTPHNFVLNHVWAKKKLAWIHTDYSKVNFNAELELPIWSRYDKIVSISPDVTKGFLSVFPSLADKILVMENILPKDYILSKADEGLELKNKSLEYGEQGILTLCSIGRISYAKNYDNIPYMARELKSLFELKDNSLEIRDFRWYIVGPGDHSEIDNLSDELGVRQNVIFLGPSDNPYPYIKNCDIYVHPSRFEGKSIVVREAQLLCKPVIITNYPTAKSQINDGVDGVICELNNKKIAQAVYNLADNPRQREQIINNLKMHDNAGVSEVTKIINLLK